MGTIYSQEIHRFNVSDSLELHIRDVECDDLRAIFARCAGKMRCFYYRSGRDTQLLGLDLLELDSLPALNALSAPNTTAPEMDKQCPKTKDSQETGAAKDAALAKMSSFSRRLHAIRRALGLPEQPRAQDMPEGLAELRLLGWQAFSPKLEHPDDPTWSGFPRTELYIPQLLLRRRAQTTTATLVCAPLQAELLWRRWKIYLAPPKSRAMWTIPSLNRPDSHWLDRVSFCEGIEHMAAKKILGRVVLARRVALTMHEPGDIYNTLISLCAEHPACTRFAIALPENEAYPIFFGTTPHRLAAVEGDQLSAVALAASAGRADEAQLLDDAQARKEHRDMIALMRESLVNLVEELELPRGPELVRLSHIAHLMTEFRATLRSHADIADVLDTLHPVPSVCGSPPKLAREIIKRFEDFDRGLYTGALGWMNLAGEGQFDVALRCGLLGERKALLFAGAGITAESDIDREWTETLQKFTPLLQLLRARLQS